MTDEELLAAKKLMESAMARAMGIPAYLFGRQTPTDYANTIAPDNNDDGLTLDKWRGKGKTVSVKT